MQNDKMREEFEIWFSEQLKREGEVFQPYTFSTLEFSKEVFWIGWKASRESLVGAENEVLRKKLTTVHFVCDRLPDQDGCRFIELENPQGESLGDESGKWEIRPDGLAQLVVEIASPDVKRMAALLECAQGVLKQAMQIIEKDTKDADRYRWLRDQPSCYMHTEGWQIRRHWKDLYNAGRPHGMNTMCVSGESLDAGIDAEMSKEKGHDQP